MTIKNKIYQNFKATIIKFLQLNVFLRRTILIFCTWVILVYVLKINLNNYWLKTLYEFLQIKYFLSLSIDKLIFAICFSCSILFLTNKLKLYYKTKYSKTRNQLDFEIRKCMQSIWFVEVTIYFYICIFLTICQIISNLFFENKLFLFNILLIFFFF